MTDTSIKKLRDTRDKTNKVLVEATSKHDKTSVDGADFAKKIGQIGSGLADVNSEIKTEVKTQMGKVETAIGADDKLVQKEIEAKSAEKSKVDTHSNETQAELNKATKIKPADLRFGAEKITDVLRRSKESLTDISKAHKKDLETGEQKRDKANKHLKEAIARNR